MSRVVARCPFGFPAAVETLPYDADGRPFPTLFYLTCPTLVAAVSRLESGGGVQRLVRAPGGGAGAGASPSWRPRPRRAAAAASSCVATTWCMVDDGASLTTGVGGVGDVRAVKCLHAHVAHALARPAYAFGRGRAGAGRGAVVR